jgi:CheY-like chemotaxis protein
MMPGYTCRSRPNMPSVLVVDDDPDVRVLLETYLELEGFDVQTACNGSDALQQLRDTRPSVILLDLMMPVMDGVEFRRHQQGQPDLRDIPVVCLSARHDAQHTATVLGVAESPPCGATAPVLRSSGLNSLISNDFRSAGPAG